MRIRWVNGVASRGKLAPPSPSKEILSVPTTPTSVVTADNLMMYFERVVLPLFNLAEQPVPVNLVAISKDTAVRQALSALASAHHIKNGRINSAGACFQNQALRLSSIENLRKQLQTQDGSESHAKSVFMAITLLCTLDGVIEPQDRAAATEQHLKGGRAILGRWSHLPSSLLLENGLPAHCLSVFATMDLINALLSGQVPYFKDTLWNSFANLNCWWGCLPNGDMFLELAAVLSQLARIGHEAHQQRCNTPIRALLPLRGRLERSASQSLPPRTLQRSTSVDSGETNYIQSWATFCSAYRLSAVIYIYRALCSLDVDHVLVQEVTREGVEAICGSPLIGRLSHCLLFPTLIIGSQCIEPEHRKRVMASLSRTASFLSFGSTQIMGEFFEELWKVDDRNINWWSCFEQISKKTFLF